MTDYRLWPATNGAATVNPDTGSSDLGLQFKVTSSNAITITGYWRWVATSQDTNGTHYSFRLYSTTNGTSGSLVTGTTVTGSGTWTVGAWNFTAITPVSLVSGTTYTSACTHTAASAHYPSTNNYWSSGAGGSGITNGPLSAPSSATALGGKQCPYNQPSTGAFPAQYMYISSNYWVDVAITVADSITVSADAVSAAATAYSAIVDVSPNAGSAAPAAVAYNATVALGVPASQATSAATANDAVGQVARTVSAAQAAVAATANLATLGITSTVDDPASAIEAASLVLQDTAEVVVATEGVLDFGVSVATEPVTAVDDVSDLLMIVPMDISDDDTAVADEDVAIGFSANDDVTVVSRHH